MRYEISDLKHISTKFIKKSLSNLTVTVDSWGRKVKTYVYSNFDAINMMVLRSNWGISCGERGINYRTVKLLLLTKKVVAIGYLFCML